MAAQDAGPRVNALFAPYDAGPSPGLAVAVVRDGEVVFRNGYGLASLEHRVPITPATVFDAASLAKQFTGLAVAMLVVQGKVKLSDDIRTYIPEMPERATPITVAHLLHHTSGIRDWVGTLSAAGWRLDDAITSRHILTMASHQRSLNFAPGAEHLYSNTGYNLLAELVQRVTGRPFRVWTDEQLFRPLKMSNTRFRDDYTEVIANRASGYARGADGTHRATPNNLAAVGSSSLFTTVDDLARWLINFGSASVGGPAVALMQTPGTLNDGTPVPYAFGVLQGSYRGARMFTHSGGWASFDTFLVYLPEHRFGVAVLANSDAIDAQNAVIAITNIFLEKELAPEPPSVAAPAPVPSAAPAAPAAAPAAPLSDYAGDYASEELGTSYRVTATGGALELQHRRVGRIALTRTSGDRFASRVWFAATVTFERDGEGRVTGLVMNGDARSRDIRFARQSPAARPRQR